MPSRIASKTYGTVGAERQKEMSGLEFVQGLVDGRWNAAPQYDSPDVGL
jgi:hypothetical protein